MGVEIRFYFDFISHNAYLAWHKIGPLADRHQRTVVPIPTLFAGLLSAHGTLGPAEVPAKRDWMLRDVMRKALRLGLPLRPPASHPFNPLLALRLVSLPLATDEQRQLIDAIFRAVWAEGVAIFEPSAVAAVADGIGLNGAALVAAAQQPAAKSRLHAQTDAAIAAGVFGVPTMIVDGELFWGFDDLGHLEQFLRGEDPLSAELLAPWRQVRPSAQRRRPPC